MGQTNLIGKRGILAKKLCRAVLELKSSNRRKSAQQLAGMAASSTDKYSYYENHTTDSVKYLSPFQGLYKLINKKIIWKAPLLSIKNTVGFISRKTPVRLPEMKRASNELSSLAPTTIQNKIEKEAQVKFAYASKTGHGILMLKKTNQDSAIACPHFGKKKDTYLFAVADGHGIFGEKISKLVTSSLKSKIF